VLTLNPLDLFPTVTPLELRRVVLETEAISFVVQTLAPATVCPTCGYSSQRIHSRYQRRLAGLPWQGRPLRLQLHVRRFICDTPDCPRRIFTERLPELATAYARTTTSLHQAHTQIGAALGGEAGARLTTRLAMRTSPDTLLRRVRQAALPQRPSVRVLGVDDWAFRKGHRYGMILIDLERRGPVDLLPERSAEALCAWLKEHPEVEIISRDRGGDMIRGATAGAPQATQVADRWHLLRNLLDALKGTVDRHQGDIRAAAQAVGAGQAASPSGPDSGPATTAPATTEMPPAGSEPCQARRARRLACYEQVRALHRQGLSRRQIAGQLRIDRSTVRRFVNADAFPERAGRRVRRSTDRFVEYLKQRWADGCRNAAKLFEELRARGFSGSYYAVRRQLARWRRAAPASATGPPPRAAPPALIERPSARRVSWLLLKADADLEAEERPFRDQLLDRSPELRTATELAQEFRRLVRERRVDGWDAWLAKATAPTAVKEIRNFAEGLKKDEAAVRAALRLEWSNGQVEGQVNRLKTIKRQMFGRANFDLLRQRVLLAV
jgi:transposase